TDRGERGEEALLFGAPRTSQEFLGFVLNLFSGSFGVEPPLLTEARKRRQYYFENFRHPRPPTPGRPPCAIQPPHPLRRRRGLLRARANDVWLQHGGAG